MFMCVTVRYCECCHNKEDMGLSYRSKDTFYHASNKKVYENRRDFSVAGGTGNKQLRIIYEIISRLKVKRCYIKYTSKSIFLSGGFSASHREHPIAGIGRHNLSRF